MNETHKKSDVISVFFASFSLSLFVFQRWLAVIEFFFFKIICPNHRLLANKTDTCLRSSGWAVLLQLTICKQEEEKRNLNALIDLRRRRRGKELKVNVESGFGLVSVSKNIIDKMSMSDLKIPSSTLAELRGVLVRALSRENLSMSDKLAIRKSKSSSSLKNHCTWSSSNSGKQRLLLDLSQKFSSGLPVIYVANAWSVFVFSQC